MEIRMLPKTAQVNEDEGGYILRGYAAMFNALSEDLGGFREIIRPGAFAQTLENDDQRALWGHDKYVLGRRSAGTLKLWEDETGLGFEVVPPNTAWARDLMESIRRGDVREMSFGFEVPEGGDAWHQEGGDIIRELLNVRLYEVSVVPIPAYPQTSVSAEARSRAQALAATAAGRDDRSGAHEQQKAASRLKLRRLRLELAEKRKPKNVIHDGGVS